MEQGELNFDPYHGVGYQPNSDTSRAAADAMTRGDRAGILRNRLLRLVRSTGRDGLTADEAAREMGESVLAVRPRMTELFKAGLIADSGRRRPNASGRAARVMVLLERIRPS